jgi:hypothetical protein
LYLVTALLQLPLRAADAVQPTPSQHRHQGQHSNGHQKLY